MTTHSFVDELVTHSVDLSNATKLRAVRFMSTLSPEWITTALQTVTPNHTNLQQISFRLPHLSPHPESDHARYLIGESIDVEWFEFDRFLVKLWESHSIRPEVQYSVYPWGVDGERVRNLVENLLPQALAKGIVVLTEYPR